jgi:hypothetical protein
MVDHHAIASRLRAQLSEKFASAHRSIESIALLASPAGKHQPLLKRMWARARLDPQAANIVDPQSFLLWASKTLWELSGGRTASHDMCGPNLARLLRPLVGQRDISSLVLLAHKAIQQLPILTGWVATLHYLQSQPVTAIASSLAMAEPDVLGTLADLTTTLRARLRSMCQDQSVDGGEQ